MTIADDGLEPVESTDDIPTFQNEAEERAYWETHTFGDVLLEQMRPAREVDPRLCHFDYQAWQVQQYWVQWDRQCIHGARSVRQAFPRGEGALA